MITRSKPDSHRRSLRIGLLQPDCDRDFRHRELALFRMAMPNDFLVPIEVGDSRFQIAAFRNCAKHFDAFIGGGSTQDPTADGASFDVMADVLRHVSGMQKAKMQVCYSSQTICQISGGVLEAKGSQYGPRTIRLSQLGLEHSVFGWCASSGSYDVIGSHRWHVVLPPTDALVLGWSAQCATEVLYFPTSTTLAVQSHPEVSFMAAATILARGILERDPFFIEAIGNNPDWADLDKDEVMRRAEKACYSRGLSGNAFLEAFATWAIAVGDGELSLRSKSESTVDMIEHDRPAIRNTDPVALPRELIQSATGFGMSAFGEESSFGDLLGFHYAGRLLSAPDKLVAARDLHAGAYPPPAELTRPEDDEAQFTDGHSRQNAWDKDARKEYAERIAILENDIIPGHQARLKDAEAACRIAEAKELKEELEELMREIDLLRQHLATDTRPQGNARDINRDPREKIAYTSTKAALERIYAALRKAKMLLTAKHLEERIQFRHGNWIYVSDGNFWHVDGRK